MALMLRRIPQLFTSANLFNKLLCFLILCLVCSGGLAAWLITQQMTHLVYTQSQMVFESDIRNLTTFLQHHKNGLLNAASDIGHDENLLIAVELDIMEEVQNITKDLKTLLEVREVVVTNLQGQIMSRGYEHHERLDPAILNTAFGVMQEADQFQLFSHARLGEQDGKTLGHVVVLDTLSDNRAFFQALRTALGKDAILFAGHREVGSTFTQPLGRFQPTPVASGLFTVFDHRFIGTERNLSHVFDGTEWRVVLLQSATPLMRSLRRVQWGTVIFTLAFIGLIALVIGFFFAVHIRKPMEVIRQGMANITRGDLTTTIHLGRRDEWRLIEQALNAMTDSLAQNAQLQTKAEALEARNAFIRDTFGRYVSDDVVAQLLDSSEGLQLGGEKRNVTILMSDVRGFTALAERLEPHEVMRFLNHYLEAMVTVILSYQGTIIEILGDGLLVIFGAPISRDDDPERAVACAVAMQVQMDDVNCLIRQEGLPEIEMGIGIHSGDVVAGNIGSQQRTKYGVVGSTVNLTGRIESYTTGNQILISPTTYEATASIVTSQHQLTVEPKGVPAPITIYDVNGIGGPHQLFLPDQTEVLTPLDEAIPVRYTVLQEKFAGHTICTGQIVKLSAKTAELQTDHPLVALSNLKLQLLRPNGNIVDGELFAKVLDTPTEKAPGVVIRFTSVPQEFKTFLAQRQSRA